MRFLADENFNNDILRGVWRRISAASFTRVQDIEIVGADDSTVLAYAAEHGYILLSHDTNTIPGHFYTRLNANLPVPGVFLVHKPTPVGNVVDALELIILASETAEWWAKITYIPLR
jgi:hypothetical protein